jgi:hypothetical protein
MKRSDYGEEIGQIVARDKDPAHGWLVAEKPAVPDISEWNRLRRRALTR